MSYFMIRFFLSNIFISGIVVLLLIVKKIFKNSLSGRMHYNLWFLLLGLLAVPFVPFRLIRLLKLSSWFDSLRSFPFSNAGIKMSQAEGTNLTGNVNWMNDFTVSVQNWTPSIAGYISLGIWMTGILVMVLLILKSALRLRAIRKSALPLQNPEVRRLYVSCKKEMKIEKDIPVFSTAFLKSPVFVGFLRPQIYLPIHLISDYHESDLRYMLLHELQHYKHKDTLAGYLMNLAVILYWFNPLVWYALKEMHNDRQIACDTSVLNMLEEDAYEDYGNTLINFAEKLSLSPFPFTAGLGGNMKQIKRRIMNIASYEKPTFMKRLKGITAFTLTAVLVLGVSPFVSTYAADRSHYQWNSSSENVSYVDLSSYFGRYDGSFVIYDLENDAWSIHNAAHASLRVSPDSTYKIFDALFGLEEGVITPEDSLIAWNGENYPFATWNADQTLHSAMSASVNWYFQAVDEQLGSATLQNYMQKIGYGNRNMNSAFSTYWLESSLKISPVEQVELLTKLQSDSFGFAPENINAVKDAICLSTSSSGTLYGKTGTGRVDGQDVNGWFIGFVEDSDNTYFFATNIGADDGASGSNASKITLSILSDMNIWIQ